MMSVNRYNVNQGCHVDLEEQMGRLLRGKGGETERLLEDLILEVLAAFFDLRAVGQRHGLVTEQGAGSWGVLRMLKIEGPQTVPDIARSRSVSRQYIQKLANELIAEGWVALEDNPLHKKSRLMALTDQGEAQLEEMTRRFRELTAQIASAFELHDLQVSTHTVSELRKQLAGLTTLKDA